MHEGDGTPLVFRPAEAVSDEPERGRMALELRADGAFREGQPGPTDRSESVDGRWSIDDDTLRLTYDDDRPDQTFEVATETDKLILTPRS